MLLFLVVFMLLVLVLLRMSGAVFEVAVGGVESSGCEEGGAAASN